MLAMAVEPPAVPGASQPAAAAAAPRPGAIPGNDAAVELAGGADPAAVPGRTPEFRESLVAIRLNNRSLLEFASVLQDGHGRFYTTADVFLQSRLRMPEKASTRFRNREYFLLDRPSPRIACHFDDAAEALNISAPPEAFTPTITDALQAPATHAQHAEPGFLLNHDFQLTRAGTTTAVSGFAETSVFNRWGVLDAHFAAQNVFAGSPSLARVDTAFIRDFPERLATLSLGDSITAGGIWARPVHFAGIRWASKFSTQPEFTSVSLPTLDGQVAEPSTIDVYVNGQKTLHQPIDPGPFSIHNVPVVTGQGDLQMVVTDILGRQQVVTRAYITTSELLRPGVSDYAFEAGTLRQASLLRSSYSSAFLSASDRRGLTQKLTVNGHAEVLGAQQTLGGGVDYAWMPLGLVSLGGAASHSQGGGAMVYAQLEHRQRALGFSGQVQLASSNFRQLGMATGERAAAFQLQAQVTHSVGNRGSVGLGYLARHTRSCLVSCSQLPDQPNLSAITASSSIRVGSHTFLSASANYSPDFKPHTTMTVSLVVPLGRQKAFSSQTTFQGSHPSSTAEFAKQLGSGTDYGYRVRTSTNDPTQIDSSFSYQNDRGAYEMQASQGSSGSSWRLHEMGGLAWMRRYIVLSRTLGDSFAVVQVPGTPGVRVFANNQLIGTTDRRGLVVVPTLVPYFRNTVRLDDSGIGLDRELELSDRLAVPMFRSGLFIKFQAEALQGALLRLVTRDGSPVPLGALVSVNGSAEVAQVALRGEAYLEHVTFPLHLRVQWSGGNCEVRLLSRPSGNPLLPIGPLRCAEAER